MELIYISGGAIITIILISLFAAIRHSRKNSAYEVAEMTGEEFEHYSAVLLEGNGFTFEQFTPVCGDYGGDIIVSVDDIRIVVQCKRYQSPVGVKAVQEAVAAKAHYHCDKAAVLTNSVYTQQAQRLASENKVILWDGATIEQFEQNLDRHRNNSVVGLNEVFIEFVPFATFDSKACRFFVDKSEVSLSIGSPHQKMACGKHKLTLVFGRKKCQLRINTHCDSRFAVGVYKNKPIIVQLISTS